MKVKFKKLSETAIKPEYKSKCASGMDLYADERVLITEFDTELIQTNIAIELPPGYEGQVRPRSGLAAKYGITVLNSPGTIDEDFKGGIGVILTNLSPYNYLVDKGDRIAQLVISPVTKAELIQVDNLSETERADGGFGSTGI